MGFLRKDRPYTGQSDMTGFTNNNNDTDSRQSRSQRYNSPSGGGHHSGGYSVRGDGGNQKNQNGNMDEYTMKSNHDDGKMLYQSRFGGVGRGSPVQGNDGKYHQRSPKQTITTKTNDKRIHKSFNLL